MLFYVKLKVKKYINLCSFPQNFNLLILAANGECPV